MLDVARAGADSVAVHPPRRPLLGLLRDVVLFQPTPVGTIFPFVFDSTLEELTEVGIAQVLANTTNRLYTRCVTGKEMVRKLQQAGWVIDRIRGSHHIMKKGDKSIPVPVDGKMELPTGTERSILRGAGLT